MGGSVADKPSRLVAANEPVELEGGRTPYASRGGEKLAAALARFEVDPTGLRALDGGASTGGFTDCLLQAGAASVVAVDVGHGQLVHRLRLDPRVVICEHLDLRDVTLATVGGLPVDMATVDLSFISVVRAIPTLVGEAVCPGGPLLILVKPQFEAGRVEASRARGVIRDPDIHRRTVGSVVDALAGAGAAIMGVMPSPLRGSAGNAEFFVHALSPDGTAGPRTEVGPDIDQLIDRAVDEAQVAGGGQGS